MELMEDNNSSRMNMESFSNIISEKWDVDGNIIKNYIFSNISVSLTRNEEMKRDVDKIYDANKLRYYNSVVNSTCKEHIIMMQGSLEQEIYARRVLGILLEAEFDSSIRSKIIKLLRKYHPIVYNSVKKHDKEKLKNKYMKMDIVTRNIEAKFDAAVYLYFTVYCSPEQADHGFIISILNDIEDFEFGSLLNQNVESELNEYKDGIQEIKTLIKREYGKVFNYKDIIKHSNKYIRNSGEFLEDLFATNKLNIDHVFHNFEFINIDKIILSYVRTVKNNENSDSIIFNIISGVFMQSLINEYKNTRKIYFEKSGEVLYNKLNYLEEKFNILENDNKELKDKVDDFSKERLLYDRSLSNELKKQSNIHNQEIRCLEEKIKELESKLSEERNLRFDIESLREYELNLNNDYENKYLDVNLEEYITNKKIIIIGGDKEWRRKFRIKYPQIRTLNGFNENFDIGILTNCDYIFFYTKYMNHSTFHKAMNFIKLNKCKFGYIGKTNIELVEQEIIEQIDKYI